MADVCASPDPVAGEKLFSDRPAADPWHAFQDGYGKPGPREIICGDQPIVARAYDDATFRLRHKIELALRDAGDQPAQAVCGATGSDALAGGPSGDRSERTGEPVCSRGPAWNTTTLRNARIPDNRDILDPAKLLNKRTPDP